MNCNIKLNIMNSKLTIRIRKQSRNYILNVLALLLCLTSLNAQGWVKKVPAHSINGARVLPTSDNGALTLHYENWIKFKIIAIKRDQDGNIQWQRKYYNGIDSSMAIAFDGEVLPTSDNGHVIAKMDLDLSGCQNLNLFKIDQFGNKEWDYHYPNSDCFLEKYNLAATHNGGFLITENLHPSGVNLLKTDSLGIVESDTTIFYGQHVNIIQTVVTNPNNTFTLGGNSLNPHKGFLLTINSTGQMVWDSTYNLSANPTHTSTFGSIKGTNDGGLVVAGTLNDNGDIGMVIKLDSQGNREWTKLFHSTNTQSLGSIDETDDGYVIQGGYIYEMEILKLDKLGNLLWRRPFNDNFLVDVASATDQHIYLFGSDDLFFLDSLALYKLTNNGTFYHNYLMGNVTHDLNSNCFNDSLETGIGNWMIRATGASNTFYGMTDASGNYLFPLDTGSYILNLVLPNALWKACHPVQIVNVALNDSLTTDFTPQTAIECPNLTVDVSTHLLRRCIPNRYQVSYCNQGTIAAQNSYVEVEFPNQMQVDSSSFPWSSQAGNVYSFSLGTINVGQCENFIIYATPICDSTILGQTMCVEAHIFPDSICIPSDTTWEGSITTLDVNCGQDSVTFTIENTGNGNMQLPLEYYVIEDELILKQGFFQLNSMSSMEVKVPTNGSTYRLYAGQSPGHFSPNYYPTTAIEGCGLNGSGTFSTGFITMFNENDVLNHVSIDCQEIIGSYDPNDKQAEPKGYGTEHYIEVGDDLNYHIRFQNVGTDTAFTVVIRDTISEHLDISSLQQGTSSHPYHLDIINGNILKFTFDNILLVDSTTNELGSHGFVKFKISQVQNLALGTMIHNSAAIYFDFNEPVITNETYHEIGEDFVPIIVTTTTTNPEYSDLSVSVQPNPFNEFADFILENAPHGDKSFELYDAMGRLVHQETFSNNDNYRLSANNLSTGVYFYKILNNNGLLISGKLIAGR